MRLKESNCQEEQKKLSRVVRYNQSSIFIVKSVKVGQVGVGVIKPGCHPFRETKEELATVHGREAEVVHKKQDLEKQLEVAQAETLAVRSDLKTAMKRVEDLQNAISTELESDNSDGVRDQLLLLLLLHLL